MPGKTTEKRGRSFSKRLTIALFLVVLIGVPIFIISTRFLPAEGAGNVFYWFHDHVYLPVKGYTYTLFYPFSIGWWGPLLTLFVVWLLSYLAMISLTKDPHARVLRRIVRRNSRHGFLLKTTQWLRKFGFEAGILKEVTRRERLKALNHVTALSFNRQDVGIFNRLFHLTLLEIRLQLVKPAGRDRYLSAVQAWYPAYMQFRNRFQRNRESEILKRHTLELAKEAEKILPVLLDMEEQIDLEETASRPAGFDLPSILLDFMYLAALHNPALAERLPASLSSQNPEAFRGVVASRLAESTASRQDSIDRSRQKMETFRTGDLNPVSFLETEPKSSWPLLLDNRLEIPISGRFALSLALDLAGFVHSEAIGLSFIESIEGLDFELNCLYPELWEAGFVHPLKDLPQSVDFRFCAELAEEELQSYEIVWSKFQQGNDQLVSPGDFQLARNHIRSLYHAAGPDFDNSGEKGKG